VIPELGVTKNVSREFFMYCFSEVSDVYMDDVGFIYVSIP